MKHEEVNADGSANDESCADGVYIPNDTTLIRRSTISRA